MFLAGPHPTPAVGEMPLVEVARRRAAELGLLGDRVAFADRWVPYDERGLWLADADVGVSLHTRHVETELSFRTRILDYFWAGLPVVCTGGDVLAELVAADDLGIVVDPGDVDGLAAALDALAGADDAEREARRQRTASDRGPSELGAGGRTAPRGVCHTPPRGRPQSGRTPGQRPCRGPPADGPGGTERRRVTGSLVGRLTPEGMQ